MQRIKIGANRLGPLQMQHGGDGTVRPRRLYLGHRPASAQGIWPAFGQPGKQRRLRQRVGQGAGLRNGGKFPIGCHRVNPRCRVIGGPDRKKAARKAPGPALGQIKITLAPREEPVCRPFAFGL